MAVFRYIMSLVLIAFSLSLKAQSLDVLKAKKEKTKKEIEYTNKLLNETGKNTQVTLNKLSLLNEQITLRNNLINDYSQQVAILQGSINDNVFIVELLTSDLQKIKENYSNMIQQAYRKRGDYNQLIFIVSSTSFNQAYKRLLYTRQMARYRKLQSDQIEAIKSILEKKTTDLQQRKTEQQTVLNQQKEETSQVNVEKSKQTSYHQQLQKKQNELKQRLREQQQIEEKLQNEIEKLIAEEARKSNKKVKTPEDKQLVDNFEKNKGRFPWPTENGVITDKFGEHAHPVMKNIIIKNNGIDITTNAGEKARSIFKGVVSKVFPIPGGNMAIIIRHGEYMSVYSNLSNIYVKAGDIVEMKQSIGLINTDSDDDNKTVLKFQLWKESVKLNPEQWISK